MENMDNQYKLYKKIIAIVCCISMLYSNAVSAGVFNLITEPFNINSIQYNTSNDVKLSDKIMQDEQEEEKEMYKHAIFS